MKEVIVNAEDLVCLNKEKLQELIRCKDCKFYWSENHVCAEIGADDGVCHVHVGDDDYCSMAERKEE